MSSNVLEAPPGVRLGNEKLIRLTEAAGRKALALRDREEGARYLRIRITGGGCNGLSYKMSFVRDAKEGDIFLESQNTPLLIDPKSALFLRGMQLDYSDKLVAGGFKFSNPNAKASCSCGESFSV